MEMLVGSGAISANVVQARHACFPSELVDEFGLPKEHHVLLILRGFFNFGGEKVTCLLLFNFENFSEGATAKLLHDFEAAL